MPSLLLLFMHATYEEERLHFMLNFLVNTAQNKYKYISLVVVFSKLQLHDGRKWI